MKITLLTICLFFILLSPQAQTIDDSLAIENAARDYLEGWQSGDVERVVKAISPELAKRVVFQEDDGHYFISDMSASLLVQVTRENKKGVRAKDFTPDEPFKLYVQILDITGDVASVKAWNTKYGFLDYCHMAKFGKEWKIVNVLWDYLPKK